MYLVRNGWDVFSSIALPGHIEIVVFQGVKELEKLSQCVIQVISDFFFRCGITTVSKTITWKSIRFNFNHSKLLLSIKMVLCEILIIRFNDIPVPTGLSMYIILWVSAQVVDLGSRVLSDFTLNGPCSLNNPNKDDPPGPPWSHNKTGLVSGLYLQIKKGSNWILCRTII